MCAEAGKASSQATAAVPYGARDEGWVGRLRSCEVRTWARSEDIPLLAGGTGRAFLGRAYPVGRHGGELGRRPTRTPTFMLGPSPTGRHTGSLLFSALGKEKGAIQTRPG